MFRWHLLLLTVITVALLCGACAQSEPAAGSGLEDTTWVLESYGDKGNLKTVLEGTEITAIFDESEGRVHGSSGCNSYGGEYRVDRNNLAIPGVSFTEMACLAPEGIMEQEEQYLRVLPVVETYESKNGKLQITAGNQLLIFREKEE